MLVIRGRLSPELGAVVQRALTADLDRGSAGDRYQVMVHVETDALRADSDSGQAVLDDGVRVSAETSRRVACDAATVVMRHDPAGTVLHVGRKTCTIRPAIRRALASRDRHCCIPGCESRYCDAHHVRHWADGGATRLNNLLLLCRRHHRAVHEDGFSVELREDGEARFTAPGDWPLVPAPTAPGWTGAHSPMAMSSSTVRTYHTPSTKAGEASVRAPMSLVCSSSNVGPVCRT